MKIIPFITRFTKRQQFVLFALLLTVGLFISEFFSGITFLLLALAVAVLTCVFLFVSLKNDIKGTFWYPIFVLPFFFSLSFALFYSLVPARLLSRIILATIYGFGLYSLFLSQNIFAVSGIRTINLLRSARIVSFVLTIVAFFFLVNVSFSARPPFFVLPVLIFAVSFFLNFQSQWMYLLDRHLFKEALISAFFVSLAMFELSFTLILWPLTPAIHSIFLTGMFYTYSGLFHAWVEKRLFKGVLLEYLWVGFLSILLLLLFSTWGM